MNEETFLNIVGHCDSAMYALALTSLENPELYDSVKYSLERIIVDSAYARFQHSEEFESLEDTRMIPQEEF